MQNIYTQPGRKQLRDWINYELKRRDLSMTHIAKELGVTRGTVQTVFSRPYPRVEKAIARSLGYKPEQIWPLRYTPKSKTNRATDSKLFLKVIKDNNTTAPKLCNGKNVDGCLPIPL